MNNTLYLQRLLLPLFAASLLTACGGDDDDDRHQPTPTPTPAPVVTTIADIASNNPDFETLTAALQATGLDATLDDENGSFTVFAPTDAAFEALGQETINALLADTDKLSAILLYHVLNTEVDAAAAVASAGTTVATANGAKVALSLAGNDLLVNTAMVTATDIQADNGIIHVIDAVLMPPDDSPASTDNIAALASANPDFSTLVSALVAAGLDTVLADESKTFTVFAPTNDAFDAIDPTTLTAILSNTPLLTDLLLQHVIDGAAVDAVTAYSLNGTMATMASDATLSVSIVDDTLTIGGVTVTTTDIKASNGIIHVIDQVIVGNLTLP